MSYYYIFCLRKQAQHSLQFIHTSYLGAGMQCDKGNLDSGLKYALPCSSCYKRLLPKKCNLQRAYMQQKLPGICRDTSVSAFMTPETCMFLSPAFRYSPDAHSLRSRGFDVYVPAVLSSQCTFRVNTCRNLSHCEVE